MPDGIGSGPYEVTSWRVLPFAQLRNLNLASSNVVNIDPALPFQCPSLADLRYVGVRSD